MFLACDFRLGTGKFRFFRPKRCTRTNRLLLSFQCCSQKWSIGTKWATFLQNWEVLSMYIQKNDCNRIINNFRAGYSTEIIQKHFRPHISIYVRAECLVCYTLSSVDFFSCILYKLPCIIHAHFDGTFTHLWLSPNMFCPWDALHRPLCIGINYYYTLTRNK